MYLTFYEILKYKNNQIYTYIHNTFMGVYEKGGGGNRLKFVVLIPGLE